MQVPDLNAFVLAYRKVKAELWHMRGLPNVKALLDYESDLLGNLQKLHARLMADRFIVDDEFLGEVYRLPKNIHATPPQTKTPKTKIHFSKITDEATTPLLKEDDNVSVLERVVATPSIDFQILGVLWIMEHGELVDRKRSQASRANVLRRHYATSEMFTEGEDQEPPLKGELNRGYPGVFRPYFSAYKRWRSDGISKIKSALKGDQRVFALTLDLKGFYHQIDAKCLYAFLKPAEYHRSKITDALCAALVKWQDRHGEIVGDGVSKLGIPVGLIASSLIANIVLNDLDDAIEAQLTPVYYGRYVDDFFLVLNLSGEFPDGESVLKEIERLLKKGPEGSPCLRFNRKSGDIDFAWSKWGNSRFESKAEKQRIFELEGDTGLDFLCVLEQATLEHSSEWRMVPDLDEEWESQLAEALVVSRDAREEANTLRKADILSLKRLGVSVALRKLEAIERFRLKSSEWQPHREAFYKLLHIHVLTPHGLCEFWPNLPRAWGLIIAQGDWAWANRFLLRIRESLRHLERLDENYDSAPFWDWMGRVLTDEILKGKKKSSRALKSFCDRFYRLSGRSISEILPELQLAHVAMAAGDLTRAGIRSKIRSGGNSGGSPHIDIAAVTTAADLLTAIVAQGESVISFREQLGGTIKPLFFPTRPISELDVCLLSGDAIDLQQVRSLCSKLRGLPESPDTDEAGGEDTKSKERRPALGAPAAIDIKPEFPTEDIRVAITNYHTSDSAWLARVQGTPDLSYKRLKCLLLLVDEFLRGIKKLPNNQKPLYLFLPELSVPREWLMIVSAYLSNARVSFITGAEYEAGDAGHTLENTAYMFLRSRVFGFPCTVLLKRSKTRPAVGEAALLLKHGKTLSGGAPEDVPFYKHGDFYFGVLLCSELMDAEFQYHFRGHVDAVVCLEWNPDLESFSALVESSALTIHSYIIQVNNREFGDSRVRAPAKMNHKRDVIRLRGGDHDYFVIGSLNIKALREYQRSLIPDQSDHAPFKPTPPGFNHGNDRLN